MRRNRKAFQPDTSIPPHSDLLQFTNRNEETYSEILYPGRTSAQSPSNQLFSPVIKSPLNMNERKLILASGSPRRNELLGLFDIPFTTQPADINEQKCNQETPRQYVIRMAYEKGHSQMAAKDQIVLSADTTVDLDGMVLGKPVDAQDAANILKLMRARTHNVHTALSLHIGEDGAILRDVSLTRVTMRNYTDEEIEAYLAHNTFLDKAGGYAIQDVQFHPVEKIEGCYTNVMGLPLCQAYRLLKEAGLKVDVNIADVCRRYNDINCEVYPSILNE